jgi:glutaredoxin 3
MSNITVYTTDMCPWCVRVKGLLTSKGLEFEEINLGRDMDSRMALMERSGMMTFPQVFIGEQLVGGYEETAAAAKSGRLDELLAA